jgi:serine/threonine protein kinase
MFGLPRVSTLETSQSTISDEATARSSLSIFSNAFLEDDAQEDPRRTALLQKHALAGTVCTSPNVHMARQSSLSALPAVGRAEVSVGLKLGQGFCGVVHEVEKVYLLPDNDANEFLLHLHSSCSPPQNSERARTSISSGCSHMGKSRNMIANNCSTKCGIKRYAVKSVSLTKTKCSDDPQASDIERAILDLASEAYFLAAAEHQHIVRIRAVSQKPIGHPHFFFLMDKLTSTLDGQLESWKLAVRKKGLPTIWSKMAGFQGTNKRRNTNSSWSRRVKVAVEISSAIAHLHSKQIMHRDLKPENIGFNAKGDACIFDLGLATEFRPAEDGAHHSDKRHYTACVGTKRYMAPENYCGRPYNESVDVYSFGVLLWEILQLKKPFEGMANEHFAALVMHRGIRPHPLLPAHIDPVLRALVPQCWSEISDDRPKAESVHSTLLCVLRDDQAGETGKISKARGGVFIARSA